MRHGTFWYRVFVCECNSQGAYSQAGKVIVEHTFITF